MAGRASTFGLFLSNKDPVRIDPVSSDFNLNAPNDCTNKTRETTNENVLFRSSFPVDVLAVV